MFESAKSIGYINDLLLQIGLAVPLGTPRVTIEIRWQKEYLWGKART
jgi:hypothetical protein